MRNNSLRLVGIFTLPMNFCVLFSITKLICNFKISYHTTRLCPLDRNINERTYTVERIAPLFKALQSEYPEYKFSWIEIEVKSIKEMLKIFPDFDLVINKADGIGIKVSCNQAVVFIEVSGSSSKPEEKHIKDDAEKLLKEATFGLVSLLRNYLGKPAEMAKNVHIYMIQCIGNVFIILLYITLVFLKDIFYMQHLFR